MECLGFKQVVIKTLKVFLMLLAIIVIIVNWAPNVINKMLNSLAMLGLTGRVGITIAVKDSSVAAMF